MKRFGKGLGLASLLWMGLSLAAMGQGTPAPQLPCAGDAMSARLQAAYPNGVPGRNLPAPMRVDKVGEDFIYYIPVVVHAMHAFGPEQYVDLAQAQSQIDVLNETFGRYGLGANTNPLGEKAHFRFCLAQIDPDGNPTTGLELVPSEYASDLDPFTEDTLMKRGTIWDPKRYMNIWTVRSIYNDAYEGYAYLPHEVAGTVWDGIVVDHRSFGIFPNGTAETLGMTITHEAGHYLGLYHPWGQSESVCGDEDTDFCDDTPPVPAIFYSHIPLCPAPDACDGTPRQVANYMDYADDPCQNMFTKCQVERMLHNTLTYRGEMLSVKNHALTGCATVLDSVAGSGNIFVYPNPATTYLFVNVDVEAATNVRIELWDMAGRKVYQNAGFGAGKGVHTMDISKFAGGIYMLHVWAANAEYHGRIRLGY